MSWRERIYRMLVALYPRQFRIRHADCIVSTLLEGADERGAQGEVRELLGLLTGIVRARGDEARTVGQGEWRHGVAPLLGPMAAVNLAVIATAFWAVQHPSSGAVVHGFERWWLTAIVSAIGLVAAVALRRRALAIAFAVAGLVPLGYDEWLQASGRGGQDHFAFAALGGFQGPLMSAFWLFFAGVLLVAALAWSPGVAKGRPLQRLVALLGPTVAIAALLPGNLSVLLGIALAGIVVCALLGSLDRRLYGATFALWFVALPYVFWWATASVADPVVAVLEIYAVIPPLIGIYAWHSRRRRRLSAG